MDLTTEDSCKKKTYQNYAVIGVLYFERERERERDGYTTTIRLNLIRFMSSKSCLKRQNKDKKKFSKIKKILLF